MTALPGDRDVQIERIAAVLATLNYNSDPDAVALYGPQIMVAQALHRAGLRVGAESVGGMEAAWNEAVAALGEGLDERSVSMWWDNRKPSGWWAAASHRFDPTRPVPLIVKGFDTKEAALHALALALGSEPK